MKWHKVLAAARKLDGKGQELTSEALAAAAGLPVKEASGYLGTFARWGLVKRVGTAEGRARWVRLFELTAWGRRYDPKFRKA